MQAQFVPRFADSVVLSPGVAHQCYHGFIKAVQEGNIQWESRTYPYPGTPITQRFSHSEYPWNPNRSCLRQGLAVPHVPIATGVQTHSWANTQHKSRDLGATGHGGLVDPRKC